ncbi:hypothetical protein VTK73DRAFT_855 [Phialemonium thermophilum]|uniref:Uncharacterized protein n=1 Tax=Phialemonium thermophilum TaxID=223376 RepID=A0ABR3VU77_9PEZI
MASFGSETGDEVALVVKRSLTLREPPAASNGRGSAVNGSQSRRPPAMPGDYPAVDAVELLRLRADLEAQKGDIERIDSAGFRMVAAINESVSRLESDMAKMRHALTEAQRETRGNQDDLASLKSDLKDVRLLAQDRTAVAELADQMRAAQAAMGEVRKSVDGTVSRMRDDLVDMKSRLHRHTESLDDLRSLVSDCISARDHNEKDVAAIRAELAQLRKQMDEGRTKQSESFPSRELDILTSSIAKIGNRASQVESLQMEFAILKGRVERIENAARRGRATASQEDDTIVAVASSPYDLYPFDDEDGYRVDNKPVAARRKRPSSGLDAAGTAGSSSAAKRAAFTSDFRDDPDGAAEWPPDETKGPPQRSVKAKGSSARATKNVRIDRRSKRS